MESQTNKAIRILHCGNSSENYDTCIKSEIAGFVQRGSNPGDLIYIAVKIGKVSYCGARGHLGNITDESPWDDDGLYIHRLRLTNLEFCDPFDLRILSSVGGKYWPLKYIQNSKPIKDELAQKLLNDEFGKNKIAQYNTPKTWFPDNPDDTEDDKDDLPNDTSIEISGTFETINFKNETDKTSGLEILVNQYFYSLFPNYPEERTLLIAENRMFLSSGTEALDASLTTTGIRGIPDALLIVYDKKSSSPFQINLIEYECYGQSKTRALQKSQHLNGHIIPQLMKFASSFSVVTDQQIRAQTAKQWIGKIINYIFQSEAVEAKITAWLKDLYNGISEKQIALKLHEALEEAFSNNIQIMLIIDELSSEQKSTIGNVIEAFKLANNNSVKFKGYVVRLEQKISLLDQSAEFAMSVESP